MPAPRTEWYRTADTLAIAQHLDTEKLDTPTDPAEITGVQGDDDTAILAALLTALDDLGLITDATVTGT